MQKPASLDRLDNTSALEALSLSVGAAISGIGRVGDRMVIRLEDGTRAELAVDDIDAVLGELTDILSAFGRYVGGTLTGVDGRSFTVTGTGASTVRVP